jgi:hypothetical protein
MPIYIFKNPNQEEYIEIFQSMNEDHIYTDDEGVEWKRQFTSPEISSQKITNPWDSNAFVNQTGSDKGTMGDLMDRSAELSEMRAKENGGIDPIKEKKFKEYSKTRGGLKDPLDPSAKKTIENKHVKVKF